ncbi:melanoma antigen preferentially expressed in tumors [Fukomys damarensis]|uniref:Melanoma antigen preferentially expressed in tumors n=1 Tax=Fukomys damarensis TaxID=885580 RepID=A0A091DLN6_FUKDA|nr:melanoma antigen preferentially expressed in tumors [Fukomys damarensis]XP_010602181.1 melanoma antigen preferentially expressed in tumors [Fukomys damarensis]XP_010602182.1 melanoma antigen preferentially expressed in tumors [Fukomys damarensis]XP_010602183.1 melanoma antigen preferentially expressed in tumors [Fukomys damarensis]XP_010602184.1 melanoma antigen preferentially expressed in tumors [Fukomys damarensis]KFO23686.1 Melanoma antigen preferentially expressed in tumors [Fukomys dam
MTMLTPPTLLELAKQSLLRDEALAIGALEELPIELFPPLFMAAYARRYSKTLKAMVQAWPFPCLPLGPLMTEQEPHQENFQAALSGLDVLLSQAIRPRRWNLQVLDLRKNEHQDFWTVWSGSRIDVWSLIKLEAAQPMKKKQKVDGFDVQGEQPLGPVKVLLDLCLKQGRNDEVLTSLMKTVRNKKGLLHLCCRKLKIFAMPMQNIEMILKMVQLDSVQDLEINCTWKMSIFGTFAPFLGQMSNIRRLLLSHILMTSCTYLEKEEQYVNQFTSQFLSFHHLQKLYLDSISFLKGRLNKVLRCLRSSLEILSITNCVLSESDLMHLSQCPSVSHLKDLSLSGVNLTTMSLEPLRTLLERASSTLEDLDLDECGIMDPQFIAILPGLSKCSQLMTFTFCGNSISMGVLQNLLLHTIGLSKLNHVLYPAPLETYEDNLGIHLGRLAHLHAKLKQMLRDAGRQAVVWFSANLCPHCGDKTLYDPEPSLCSCYLPL